MGIAILCPVERVRCERSSVRTSLFWEMGKANWTVTHYLTAMTAFGGQRPALKLSNHCDKYSPFAKYAGIIVYSSGGSFSWPASETKTGSSGRFAYLMIKNTGKWKDTDFRQQARGRV